ncbi:FkbM family methyltransferase [Ekhidna sp.]|uniref:FkbM family methyltransferase n=1 Tax=Ekhidna sp. TaxID=2608089 RepID=UPI003299285A
MNCFFESEFYKQHASEPLVIVDGGARGELFPPLRGVKTPMNILAFDPDDHASIISNEDAYITIFKFNKGLWNNEVRIKVHIAKDPSTSSVYPPNIDLIKSFEDAYGIDVRSTEYIIEVDGITIDKAIEESDSGKPHFIKLDIHSAEYEALEGAKKALKDSVMGVLVETWHQPIHEGQYLHADVEKLLNEKGFYIFDQYPVGRWDFKKNKETIISNKPCYVLSESLFFKYPNDFILKEEFLKFIGFLDVFGYTSLAMNLVRSNSLLNASEKKATNHTLSKLEQRRYNSRSAKKMRVKNKIRFILRKIGI